jgi:DNA repair/transcription protein MET18/MMS19
LGDSPAIIPALVSRYALDQIIPHLLKLFADPDEIANRASTLAHLASIVETTRDLTDKDKPEQPIIFSSKDQVLGIFTTALKTRSTALPALNGLRGLVDTKDLLTDEELGFVVHSINEVIQDDEDDEIR